jgi:hypothetical protein
MTARTRTTRRPISTLTAGLLAALVIPALAAPPASADEDQPECGDTSTIAGAPDLTRTLARGVLLRSWNSRVAEVDVVSSEPGASALRVWTAPTGTIQKVRRTLEVDGDAVAAVNGDFFTGGSTGRNPVSDVVIGGTAKYLVPGSVPSLTVDERGRLHATTVRASGTATFSWVVVKRTTVVKVVKHKKVRVVVTKRYPRTATLRLSGVNSFGNVTDDTAVLFTRTWPSTVAVPARTRIVRTPGSATPKTKTPPVSLVTQPTQPWLAFGSSAAHRLARVPSSAVARFAWNITAADGSQVRDAIGRGAILLRDGYVITNCAGDDRPRTAVGWDQQGHVWIMTAQGGARENVVGGARMGGTTNFQMAQWLHQLGATDGATFDGGGSTDLEVRTQAGIHRADLPDSAFARQVPNGMILVPRS